MIDTVVERRCTACSSCQNICPVSAIKLTADEEGFSYPTVDYKKCVNCRICLTHCPVLTPLESERTPQPDVYAAWNIDQAVRMESTSGGVFSALARAIIEQGGYIVGAEYDADFQVHHTIINTLESVPRQRQSKYAQSDLGNTFQKVKALLEEQNLVLFCGTPCQSAGLQKYLGKSYERLFCCDFICRGVISPKVYRKFLEDMRPEKSTTLQKVHFKNKDYGWNRFSTKLIFTNGDIYQKDRDEDYYMCGYLKHNLYLRSCCHKCAYKTFPRVSDLSLGDFWGIRNYDPELDNEMGTSVILVNSEKGRTLFDWARKYLELNQRTLEEVITGNSCLLTSAPEGQFRSFFFDNISKYNFAELIKIIDHKSERLTVTDRFLRTLYTWKQKLLSNWMKY